MDQDTVQCIFLNHYGVVGNFNSISQIEIKMSPLESGTITIPNKGDNSILSNKKVVCHYPIPMNCSNCQSNKIVKNGTTKLEHQRYRCATCGKSWSDNPVLGRPSVNKIAMTNAERQKRFRNKRKRSRFQTSE